MTPTPTAIVRDFYERLAANNVPGALTLMAADIEWITMWHYKVEGRGPDRVVEGLFKPLAAEWTSFSFKSTEFINQGDTVVSLGEFNGCMAPPTRSATRATPTSGR